VVRCHGHVRQQLFQGLRSPVRTAVFALAQHNARDSAKVAWVVVILLKQRGTDAVDGTSPVCGSVAITAANVRCHTFL
jgi:hypothetical protein